jgi:hypothetical protein
MTDPMTALSSPSAMLAPSPSTVAVPANLAGRSFAHASEAELARILDFYGVAWTYEPDTFPIGWNLDGDVVESFSPDFFLPDLDLYVELTTLKQKLVRRKNRKLRRLRELYPDVRIKLFYARDFRMLLLKFGRMALVDELTGTTGQATPPRVTGPKAEPAPSGGAEGLPMPPDLETAVDAGHGDADPASRTPLAEGRGRRRGRRRRRGTADAPAVPVDSLGSAAPDPAAP